MNVKKQRHQNIPFLKLLIFRSRILFDSVFFCINMVDGNSDYTRDVGIDFFSFDGNDLEHNRQYDCIINPYLIIPPYRVYKLL